MHKFSYYFEKFVYTVNFKKTTPTLYSVGNRLILFYCSNRFIPTYDNSYIQVSNPKRVIHTRDFKNN